MVQLFMRPLDNRKTLAVLILSLILFVNLVSLIPNYFLIEAIKSFENGDSFGKDIKEILIISQISTLVTLIKFVLSVLGIITFMMWMRRAYYNLGIHVKTKVTDGWAVGYWFIPFLNFYKPLVIMLEMFNKTSDYLKMHIDYFKPKPYKTILIVWWVLWILNTVGFNSFLFFARNSGSQYMFYAFLVTAFISIPLTVLIVLIILRYTNMAAYLTQITDKSDDYSENDFSDHLTAPDLL